MYTFPSKGINAPQEVNVVIEINAAHVKYEFDKKTGMLFVDRFLSTSMVYPCNYGFVPETLAGDGDPLDILVHTTYPVMAGSVLVARPIGVLLTEDESGQDEKIIAVPSQKIDPFLAHINSCTDLPELLLMQIQHFFEHYKDLEPKKWVKVLGWKGVDKAYEAIIIASQNYDQKTKVQIA